MQGRRQDRMPAGGGGGHLSTQHKDTKPDSSQPANSVSLLHDDHLSMLMRSRAYPARDPPANLCPSHGRGAPLSS